MNWQQSMNWRDDLRRITEAVPDDDLPDLIGELHRAAALAGQRMRENGQPSAPQSNGPALDGLLTAEEVADRLETSTRWVRRHRERLGGRKLDGLLRFPQSAVQRYIDAAPAR